jgi:hypothetical protein
MKHTMALVDDLSRSLVAFNQNITLTAVVEMSAARWLVAGLVPGIDRLPVKKLDPDPGALWRLLERWRTEAVKAGRTIARITLAYEAGRDGFWLARWLRARGARRAPCGGACLLARDGVQDSAVRSRPRFLARIGSRGSDDAVLSPQATRFYRSSFKVTGGSSQCRCA